MPSLYFKVAFPARADIITSMFVRQKTSPNSPRTAVQIVANRRVDGKIKQRIIRHLGTAETEEGVKKLMALGEALKHEMREAVQPSLSPADLMAPSPSPESSASKPLNVDLRQLRETERYIQGVHRIYGQIYQELGLHRLLPVSRYRSSNQALRHCVMARLANPQSKRASVDQLEQDMGVHLPLEKVYRMMDHLDDQRITRLKEMAWRAATRLYPEPVNVLLFDCTTLYFESVQEDALRQTGYSKDGKFKESQVVLALAVTCDGLPLSYEVFPGSCYEGHTLIPVLQEMQQRQKLNQVICVADRGMMSRANMTALEEAGLHYIVGGRLRQLPHAVQKAQLWDRSGYRRAADSEEDLHSFEHEGRRWVVSYSEAQARKDEHDRTQSLERLLAKLRRSDQPQTLVRNSGYRKYIQLEGDARVCIDETRVAQEQRWDGLQGVVTNLSDWDARAVLAQYRGLWQVEACFRVSQHDLRVRPIFHWTPSRIRAHLAIAFMSLMCARHLMYRVALQAQALSPQRIRQALVQVQFSILKHQKTQKRYVLPSKLSRDAEILFRVMGQEYSQVPYELDEPTA